jgi:dihydroorotate dehydrogenase electron transfer subunit
MNYPLITKIIEIKNENNNVKTIMFRCNNKITPGQFYMIWIPGVDEIPMSVSYINKNIKGITFKKIGEATTALFNLKKGDKIGVRGPYGKGFKVDGKKILFVGGGTGIAMLAPVIEKAIKKKIKSTVIIGAKTKKELFFEKRIKDSGAELYISTEDGTHGIKGLTTDLAKDIIKNNQFDFVLTCGPELMMKKLMKLSKDIYFQASLERFMKCGFGICGQCCIGEGIRVCTEGPIFDKKTLRKIQDFGIFKRNASGKKIKF